MDRKCIVCGDSFEPQSNRQKYCLKCRRIKDNESTRRYYHTKLREDIRRRKREIIERMGGKCQRCGFDDWRALEIHHPKGIKRQYTWDFIYKRKYDITKLELLCANCHAIEHWDGKKLI